MSEQETPVVRVWEKAKDQAKCLGLNLVVDGSRFRVENGETEGVYFQAKDLESLNIYLDGYEYGCRDTLKSK